MNKKLLVTVIGGVLACASVSSQAIEAEVSGHINRALMRVDDGTIAETHNVDNGMSATRFRFRGSAEVQPGIKGGVRFEADFASNPSDAVTQTDRSVEPEFSERWMSVYLHGGFGKISLGQGDGAANGGIEVDLSGTSVITGTLSHNLGGNMEFKTSAGVGVGAAIGDALSNQDFESRYDRLRYNTPALGPAVISVSTGTKSDFDVREIATEIESDLSGAGKLAAALGYSEQETATPGFDNTTVGGSASWLSPTGLSLTLAYSKQDITPARTGDFNYVKLGYRTGLHAFSVDYTLADDQAAAGDEASRVMLGYVYQPVKWAELYAGYHINSLDRPGVSVEDITVLAVGSRLKF